MDFLFHFALFGQVLLMIFCQFVLIFILVVLMGLFLVCFLLFCPFFQKSRGGEKNDIKFSGQGGWDDLGKR